ncbi:hypothetical protein [Natronosalvus caseinilyticus]|uniref:hypothetical protein n=1 Tax=Natronosalvus caseinilyticus TaxID=2953747 RepID=UPI0028AB7D53|nr:hypothetical protein [Natronosalvus caseinilyticus]
MYSDESGRSTLDPRMVQRVTKLGLASAAVVVVLWVATLLPGAGWLVPGTSLTVAALLSAVATLAVVGLLLLLAPALADLVKTGLRDAPEVAERVASVTRVATVLAAVLVAHRGLAAAITPLLGGFGWLYDVVFLLLALPLLVALAVVLYGSLEPTTDLFATKLVGSRDEQSGLESS